MRRALDLTYLVCGWLAGFFVVAIAVLVLVQVIARLLGLLAPTADEFGGYCLAASSFLALAYTFRAGGHIRVNVLLQNWRGPGRRAIELWCLAAAALGAGYFAYYAAQMVWESFLFGDVGQGLVATPLWIPQIGVALGIAVFCLALVEELIRVWRGEEPVYAAAEAESDTAKVG